MPVYTRYEDDRLNAISFKSVPVSSRFLDRFLILTFGVDFVNQVVIKENCLTAKAYLLDSKREEQSLEDGVLTDDIFVRRLSIDNYNSQKAFFYKEISTNVTVDLTTRINNSSMSTRRVYSPKYEKKEAGNIHRALSTEEDPKIHDLVFSYVSMDLPKFSYSENPSYEESQVSDCFFEFIIDIESLNSDTCWIYVDLLDSSKKVRQTIYQTVDLPAMKLAASIVEDSPQIAVRRDPVKKVIGFFSSGNLQVQGLKTPNKKTQEFVTLPLRFEELEVRSSRDSDRARSYKDTKISVMSSPRRDAIECRGFIKAQQLDSGYFLRAYNIPQRSTSISFYVSDMSLKKPAVLLQTKTLVKDQSQANTKVNLQLDTGKLYKFFYRCVLASGLTFESFPDHVEVMPFFNGLSTKISNFSKTADDITFSVSTEISQKNTETAYNLFKSRGLDTFYKNYIENSEDISKLISHYVVRTDITTGEKIPMGLVVDAYQDSKQSVNRGVQKANPDRVYEFEVFPCLVDPNTVFDSQKREIITAEATVMVNNQKFRHPLSILNSCLFTPTGLREKFSKNIIESNLTAPSVVTQSEIAPPVEEKISISTSFIVRNKKRYFLLSWNNINRVKKYDVYKVSLNSLRFLGTVAPSSIPFYLDTIDDLGDIRYIVVPTHADGTLGELSSSRTVIEP